LPVFNIIKRSRRETVPSLLQFPEKLGAHSMLLLFKSYKYEAPGEFALNKVDETLFSQRLSSTQSVLLPLPANIEDNYNVNVRGYEQGIGGAAVSSAAAGFASRGDISTSNLLSILGSGVTSGFDANSLTNLDNFARGAAFLGRRAIDQISPSAGKSVDSGLGSTINPKASLYFEGVTQKVHNFTWTLAPSNERDSDSIRNITNLIKRNSLPSYGSLGFSKILLNYPSMLDIFFLGVDQSYFLYYKTCMVQSFTTNYTPQGLAFVKGGKPSMVTMTMNVIEADIHTAEDYGGEGTTVVATEQEPSQRGNQQ